MESLKAKTTTEPRRGPYVRK